MKNRFRNRTRHHSNVHANESPAQINVNHRQIDDANKRSFKNYLVITVDDCQSLNC